MSDWLTQNAVVVINACVEAFDRVGMPEGRYHLAQATLYLATAPKSNSVMGFSMLWLLLNGNEQRFPLT